MHCLLLLAQASEPELTNRPWSETLLQNFANNPGLVLGLVAIVGAFTFQITKAILRHKERIAMIEQGYTPEELNKTKHRCG